METPSAPMQPAADALAVAFSSVRAEVPSERRTELGNLLAARIAEARSTWEASELDPLRFVVHLAARIDPRDEAIAELELIRIVQLWLAWAASLGDARAIQLLESEQLSRMPAFIARVDRSPAFVDEVMQQLRSHLFIARANRAPGIAGYAGRGELGGWLRVLALRTAQRLRRAQRKQLGEEAAGGEPDLLGLGDPERDYLKARYQKEYDEAFQAALGALSVRERLFLRLHYLDGLNIDKIGRLYQLHRSTVARRLAEHRRRVLELTRDHLRARLNLSDSEFDSVLLLVRSQLAISFRSALGP